LRETVVAQNSTGQRREAGDFHEPITAPPAIVILLAIVSIIAFRFRSRAALELKLVALQHRPDSNRDGINPKGF
jgi:hypothetical protein